jgi:hypothetical protein
LIDPASSVKVLDPFGIGVAAVKKAPGGLDLLLDRTITFLW